ncbi:hypothetical protein [Halogeometricum limi]|uniref:Uncharacterized protein n=1 Tax=Halogeometricum limi TaxID=555875 RepID=A0A1I6I2V9_9EURY|nr:hypothetical protein [Halogeometricum limi]SFR61035.1 hypothetical protein SAMN04488124_2744 [Halogeometricum limi]
MSTSDALPSWSADDRRRSTRWLSYVAAALVLVVAGLHLFHPSHGLAALSVRLFGDPSLLVYDPRPLAFVLSAFALAVGVPLARNAPSRRPYYAVGIAILALYLGGYFAWHFSGHGSFLPGREPLHHHGVSPLQNVVNHLTAEPLAAVSKTAELAGIAVLGVLFARE